MIVVCGPTKVGKTTALQEFTSGRPKWHHVVASDILIRNKKSINDLSITEAIDNQICIKQELSKMSFPERLILDGHLLIRLKSGFCLVQPDIFSDITVTDIVFVSLDKCLPVDRICSGHDLDKIANECSTASCMESLYSQWMARLLGAQHHHVPSGVERAEKRGINAALTRIEGAIENDFRRT